MSAKLHKPVFFIGCSLPLVWMVWNGLSGGLGANPVETITHQTGDWALRCLLLTLALTPARIWLGWGWTIRLRRMSGLFTYFYAACHFLIWFLADHALSLASMWEDVLERPYISMGFSAFLLLTPLAITSNQWSIRRLGKRWKRLHQAVYLIVILAVVHYLWLVKADYLEPLIYGLIAVLLLFARALPKMRGNAQSRAWPSQKVAN